MSLGRIFCKDVSVLLFHNEFCKSQTNAGAVFGSVGAPIKPLKQMRQIFFCKISPLLIVILSLIHI